MTESKNAKTMILKMSKTAKLKAKIENFEARDFYFREITLWVRQSDGAAKFSADVDCRMRQRSRSEQLKHTAS